MKTKTLIFAGWPGAIITLPLLLLSVVPLVAQTTWTGTGANDNWSTLENWTVNPSGQNVLFTDAGAAVDASTVTSIVDDDYSVESLAMDYMSPLDANTNTYQNIQIAAGKTLTVNGNLSIGATTEVSNASNRTHSNYMTIGGAGSLAVNGGGTGSLTVLPPNTGSPQFRYFRMATLHMQNLSSFSATNLDRFVLGADKSGNIGYTSSWVVLAQTNTIQASTLVMDGYVGSSRMEMGTSNMLHIDNFLIGHQSLPPGQQTWAQATATLTFRTGLSGATVEIRGKDGVSGADMLVGRSGLPYLSSITGMAGEGVLNLEGGTTDAKVNNLVIGLADQGTTNLLSGTAVSGSVILGAGKMEAANVVVGRTTTGNTNTNSGVVAVAALAIKNGGTLDVAGNLLLGDAQQGTIALTSTVNLQNGLLKATTISTGANAAGNKAVAFNWSQDATIQNHAGANLAIATGVDLTLLGTGAHTFNIDADRTGTVASNILSSVSGSVVKNGAGMLEITSMANTYSGATIVNAGTLLIDGDISTSSGVTVNSGAALEGAGAVSSIVLNSGGTLGNNSLNATSLTWNGVENPVSAQYQIDLASSSRLELTETFTKGLGTYFVFDLLDTGALGTYTLLSGWTSTNFTASDFRYVDLGTGLSGTFSITDNSLNFTVIPEPSTVLLGILGLLMLTARARFRRLAC